jgi:anti-sigma factor RsiW
MAGNPACSRYVPLLSPYIDGELAPGERVTVERHLAACRDCTGRTADLRAESGLVRVGLEMAADEVDFKDFAQKVMARVTPERPPLLERLRLTFSEMMRYQRTAFVSSLATAAVVLLVAVPLLARDSAPVGYAAEHMTVQAVRTHGAARVAPVVMEAEDGNAIIWLVDEQKVRGGDASDESQSDELEMDGERPALQPQVKPKPQQEGEL